MPVGWVMCGYIGSTGAPRRWGPAPLSLAGVGHPHVPTRPWHKATIVHSDEEEEEPEEVRIVAVKQ